jgi:hypothetical protein
MTDIDALIAYAKRELTSYPQLSRAETNALLDALTAERARVVELEAACAANLGIGDMRLEMANAAIWELVSQRDAAKAEAAASRALSDRLVLSLTKIEDYAWLTKIEDRPWGPNPDECIEEIHKLASAALTAHTEARKEIEQ